MFHCAKKYSQILLLGVLVPAATAFGGGKSDGKNRLSEHFVPGKDSYRASFDLQVARRFATRYLRDSRALEVRVSPARASEFDVSRFYDTRYIHRVVVEEKNNEVVLSFQLKNAPVSWLVTHQENPWRLMVDIWRTEPVEPRNFEQEWEWQDDANGKVQDTAALNSNVPAPNLGFEGSATQAIQPLMGDGGQIRLESVATTPAETMATLERRAGSDVGTVNEFDSIEKLAIALYRAGSTQQALSLLRRLASLNSRRFLDSPRLLWMAGESAYLTGKADLSNDYLQSLTGRFAGQETAALGQLRLADLRAARLGPQGVGELKAQYTDIALNDRAPWAARIGAALRLLEPVINTRPEAARAHQPALQSCLNGNFVSEQVRQSCAFVQTKFAINQLDVVSADASLQRYRTRFPKDPRTAVLDAELSQRVRFVVDEYARKKDFPALAEFERSARPGLMDFTLRDPALLMARVDGWLSVGDNKRALGLLQLFTSATSDESKRNEGIALMAQLQIKGQQTEKAEANLKKVFASDVRRNSGLSDRATASVREAARSPYLSKTAQIILLEELKFGRYVERDVGVLVQLAAAARGRDDADKVFDTLMTTAPRNDSEARGIESALIQYADDLRGAGRLAKSGDVFMAVANLGQSTRKAESAYKAGIAYARAGMVEKAKTAWQLSAADITDKKFSSLASERLERIR
ncbi:hypothetical protein EBU99_08570 [bacterium]|nr:hypothetical protein [bacterium]